MVDARCLVPVESCFFLVLHERGGVEPAFVVQTTCGVADRHDIRARVVQKSGGYRPDVPETLNRDGRAVDTSVELL